MVPDLERYLKYFDSRDFINTENKESFHWFINECAAEGLSRTRQCKYVYGFVTLYSKFIPSELVLEQAGEQNLKGIVAKIHNSQYTDATKCFLKQCIKKFFKLRNQGRVPRKVDFIKTTQKKATTVTHSQT